MLFFHSRYTLFTSLHGYLPSIFGDIKDIYLHLIAVFLIIHIFHHLVHHLHDHHTKYLQSCLHIKIAWLCHLKKSGKTQSTSHNGHTCADDLCGTPSSLRGRRCGCSACSAGGSTSASCSWASRCRFSAEDAKRRSGHWCLHCNRALERSSRRSGNRSLADERDGEGVLCGATGGIYFS